MSDMIWHYCCLMGGVSASSARGIRTSTAGAVCLNLNLQLHLLQSSTSDSAWQPPPRCEGEDRHKIAPMGLGAGCRRGHKRGRGGWVAALPGVFGAQRARRLTDCPLWDDRLFSPVPSVFRSASDQSATWLHDYQQNTWLSASGFPRTKTAPCWQSCCKLWAHRLIPPFWSLGHDEMFCCKSWGGYTPHDKLNNKERNQEQAQIFSGKY